MQLKTPRQQAGQGEPGWRGGERKEGLRGALGLQSVSQFWAQASFTNIWHYVTHLLPKEAVNTQASGSGFPQGQGGEAAVTCSFLPPSQPERRGLAISRGHWLAHGVSSFHDRRTLVLVLALLLCQH